MIKLDVEEYCQDCPRFEVDLIKNNMTSDYNTVTHTTIKCKHRNICKGQVRYLKKKLLAQQNELDSMFPNTDNDQKNCRNCGNVVIESDGTLTSGPKCFYCYDKSTQELTNWKEATSVTRNCKTCKYDCPGIMQLHIKCCECDTVSDKFSNWEPKEDLK